MVDVLQNKTLEIQCLDKGFVRLVDCMPRLVEDGKTADVAIVQMARVSYGDGTKKDSDDRALIRYLMRHRHTSPFEGIEFKFHIKLPIFVLRQIIRTRTASVNEISGRYSILKDEFYIPNINNVRLQSKVNKQGSGEFADKDESKDFIGTINALSTDAFFEYNLLTGELDISREQARIILPLNTYTELYWKIDLHNLLHFLDLRTDLHAQQETREYANAILNIIKSIVPITIEAWEDYSPYRGGMSLTRLEVEELKRLLNTASWESSINSDNKREKEEWQEKLKKLKI